MIREPHDIVSKCPRDSYKQHPHHCSICSSHGHLMFSRNFFSESLSAWPALAGFHNGEKQGCWPTFSLSLYRWWNYSEDLSLAFPPPPPQNPVYSIPTLQVTITLRHASRFPGMQAVWQTHLDGLKQAAVERQDVGIWKVTVPRETAQDARERPPQRCCNLERISLLYKNNYVISLDLLELEAF